MKPAAFDYFAPTDLREALALLEDSARERKLLAGGQSLVPMMNLRLSRPERLIDLNGVPGLAGITRDGDDLTLGAMTRQTTAEESLAVGEAAPALRAALHHVGHRPTRNRGTVGGSIVHADPAAEIPCVWLAHDGEIVLVSASGTRTVQAAAFFETYFTTDTRPDEIAIEVRLAALPPRTGWGFHEFARRRGDFALLSCTALVTLDRLGRVQRARLVAGGAADVPLRLEGAEQVLLGEAPTPEAIAQASEAAAAEIRPPDDVHAPVWFRRRLARVLTGRAVCDALTRVGGGEHER